MRTLYVTGITTSALAFIGGMATCAAIIWLFTPTPSAEHDVHAERPIPASVREAGLGEDYLRVSEERVDGVRFRAFCGEGFVEDLGCATVREATTSAGARLGVALMHTEGCALCDDLGLRGGDVVTHVGRGAGRARQLRATSSLVGWMQVLSEAAARATSTSGPAGLRPVTVRILRDGRPALLTRSAP